MSDDGTVLALRPSTRRRLPVACVIAVMLSAAACGDSGGQSERQAGSVSAALVEVPSVAEGAADLGAPIDADGSDAGTLGARLGEQIAVSVLDMSRLEPAAYRQRFDRDASRQALLLGRFIGSIETVLPAVIDGADDEADARREAVEFGLAVWWPIAEAFDPAAPPSERVLAVMTPDLRERAESSDAVDEAAQELAAGQEGAAADTLLAAFPELDPANLFAEMATELSERMPAEQLSAFLSSFDVTRRSER